MRPLCSMDSSHGPACLPYCIREIESYHFYIPVDVKKHAVLIFTYPVLPAEASALIVVVFSFFMGLELLSLLVSVVNKCDLLWPVKISAIKPTKFQYKRR